MCALALLAILGLLVAFVFLSFYEIEIHCGADIGEGYVSIRWKARERYLRGAPLG